MAKGNLNSGSATLLDEEAGDVARRSATAESYARPSRSSRPVPDPGADPDPVLDEPFLRARRRVPVRRGLLPAWARTQWGRVAFAAVLLAALAVLAALAFAAGSFLLHDSRFRIESAASIQTLGNSELTRPDLLSVFGSDVRRNLFLVPLAKRQAALEQIPWVEHATVMRLLPNQLRVAITERTPIAFVQVHGRIALADANGVILDMTPLQMAARRYSFPVVTGVNPSDPLTVRSARMHIYQRFLSDLDSSGEHISAQLSEVDLSDPDDVRAIVPNNGSDLLLHFGQEDFLARWHNYQAHIAQWQQQYPQLASIDFRYDHQVVLKMAGEAETTPATNATPKPASPAPQPSHPAQAEHKAARKPSAAKHDPPGKPHESAHNSGNGAAHASGHEKLHTTPAKSDTTRGAA